ncbi:HalOD1 output domain-containing protein [Halorubrum halophilum]|uniref:HalOD1 output domain-containing protein n=1 Tax=Halorubrum halophilum TaxID=413816 RepID=UPI000678CBDC|nr:HalOD1 output domain-containing protein [Halorubrum halophilum]
MGDTQEFYYEPDEGEQLSTAVVTAIAKAHDEGAIDQKWLISDDINTDALDGLFQERNLKMTLQFEADTTTATITADTSGNPIIKIESHR